MVVLGGVRFLMSEVPLYTESERPAAMRERYNACWVPMFIPTGPLTTPRRARPLTINGSIH